MQEWSITLAYLTAGVSLSIGSICFFVGVQRREKSDLIFGLMGISLSIFLLMPPAGFIIADQAPYVQNILIKRIFIFGYNALFPWFIRSYTGSRDRVIPASLSVLAVANYLVMSLTTNESARPIWSTMAQIAFGAIALYWIISGISQYRKGEIFGAKWFLLAITVYACLSALSALNKITYGLILQTIGMQIFFPIHFHALIFLVIMGLRTVADAFQKYERRSILNRLIKDNLYVNQNTSNVIRDRTDRGSPSDDGMDLSRTQAYRPSGHSKT